MESLKSKKILLICAKLFGYELEIQARLKELGAEVIWYDQRPSNSFLVKGLIRIDNRILHLKIRKYYERIITQTQNVSFDYVFFISPETVTESLLLKMKDAQASATFVLFMWDSLKNKSSSIKNLISHFDYRYSFDRDDCKQDVYGLRYRPLFFLNDYSKIESSKNYEFDLLFIGTIHSDRYKILSLLKKCASDSGLSIFYYMFFSSSFFLFLKYLTDRSFRQETLSSFKTKPLKKSEVLEYVSKSKAIIDIQHPNQLGLTMRTIEVLGARRKLITTNNDIVNYDFYHPQNILVIDRYHPKIEESFFSAEMIPVEEPIYSKYSIDGWIAEVLNLKFRTKSLVVDKIENL